MCNYVLPPRPQWKWSTYQQHCIAFESDVSKRIVKVVQTIITIISNLSYHQNVSQSTCHMCNYVLPPRPQWKWSTYQQRMPNCHKQWIHWWHKCNPALTTCNMAIKWRFFKLKKKSAHAKVSQTVNTLAQMQSNSDSMPQLAIRQLNWDFCKLKKKDFISGKWVAEERILQKLVKTFSMIVKKIA